MDAENSEIIEIPIAIKESVEDPDICFEYLENHFKLLEDQLRSAECEWRLIREDIERLQQDFSGMKG